MLQNRRSFFGIVAKWLNRSVLNVPSPSQRLSTTDLLPKTIPDWTENEIANFPVLECQNRLTKLYDLIFVTLGLYIPTDKRNNILFFNMKLRSTFGVEMKSYLEENQTFSNESLCFEAIASYLRVSTVFGAIFFVQVNFSELTVNTWIDPDMSAAGLILDLQQKYLSFSVHIFLCIILHQKILHNF